MQIIRSVKRLRQAIHTAKSSNKTIGFTPTMGALHKGHFSLIERSIQECDTSICSIFVNPTQFNQESDFDQYPRTEELDCEALELLGCDIAFIPSKNEIYPPDDPWHVEMDLKGLDEEMEGKHRPEHFKGVVQVVKRLLDIVMCDKLYMGQKDFQQFTIIQYMIDYFKMPVKLVVCPILREEDGLAMSSRNRRLKDDVRKKANILYRVLCQSKSWLSVKDLDEIERLAMEFLSVPPFKPEYFSIIDGLTLQKVHSLKNNAMIVACTAVWADDVRLIDNMILRERDE